MRRLLFVVLLVLFSVPAAASASADKLHGSWKLTAVAVQDMRVEVPPTITVVMDFDKTKRTWTLHAKIENDTHQATGTWRVSGKQLFLAFQGEEAPPVDMAIQGNELSLSMALPEGERYTAICTRTPQKAAPKPLQPPAAPSRPPAK